MKKRHVAFVLMLLWGCVSNETVEIQNTEEAAMNPAVVEAIDYLNKQIDNGDFSLKNQFQVLSRYASEKKINFQPPKSYKPKQDIIFGDNGIFPGVSRTHQEVIMSDLLMLDSYLADYGVGKESLSLIREYKSSLNRGVYLGFDKSELDILRQAVMTSEFIAGSSIGKQYFASVLAYRDRQTHHSEGARTKGIFQCIIWSIQLVHHISACGALILPSCGLIPYYTYRISQECEGDTPTGGPCLESSDPCCGVQCISGYVCDSGDCVEDWNAPPPCGGCPEGSFCNGMECVFY